VHKSADSKAKYETTIGQWLARGRAWPLDGGEVGLQATDKRSVAFVAADYLTWAEQQYKRKDGRYGTRFRDTKAALKPLCALFAHKVAAEFTPMDLETIQTGMVRGANLCRKTIKERIDIIKRAFRRAASRGLIPAPVSGALECADALPTHHPDVRESRVVKPVAQHLIDGVRPLVSRQVRAMIDLQLLTAARPGELFSLTTAELDTTGEVWKYKPKQHKTAHHGKERVIFFNKDAQAILQEFMTTERPMNAPLFSPKEAEAERRAAQHEKRLKDGTPLSCGNRPGSNRKDNPQRQPGDKYTDSAYSSAVERVLPQGIPSTRRVGPRHGRGEAGA
jgi:integrase